MWKAIKHHLRTYRLQRAGFPESILVPLTSSQARFDWQVDPRPLNRDSVVYSFGVGDNIRWDLFMIEQFGMQVHAFDPTPESIQWVAKQSLPPEFVFHDLGLAGYDGTLEFFPPKKPGRMHYSQDRQKFSREDSEKYIGQVRRLKTVADMLGHKKLDVLKLDIEGSEFEAIPDLLESGIPIDQLLVEIHYTYPSRSLQEGISLAERIREHGYRCVYVSGRGLEFGFLHERILSASERRAA